MGKLKTQSSEGQTRQSEQLPRGVLQFRSECKFADAPAAEKSDGQKVPFSMTARTAEPIDHWYWGRIVHDMSGMKLSKPTLPVDYCHDPDEVMGYADQFSVDTGDLVVSGVVIPMPDDDDDRASDVIYKQKLGVPYEASIDFSGGNPVIEYVPTGASVDVNGEAFQGPGVVVRQWTLRGLAICPYGADPNTSTAFAADSAVTVTTINKPQGESQMSKQANTAAATPAAVAGITSPSTQTATQLAAGTTPAAAPATAAAQPATAAPAADPGKPQAKYISAFGDVGARWFLENKPFEDCTAEFIGQLKKSHADELALKQKQFSDETAALQTKLQAAEQKLAAIGRGDEGVTFSNAEGKPADAKLAKLASNLTPGLAKFAAAMKLPTSEKK